MTEEPNAAVAADRAACPHCGEVVPRGTFCGHCGAHLVDDARGRRRRGYAFAASPHEGILDISLVTTLFPHLPHHNAHMFRRVGGVASAAVLLLVALRLQTPATVAAATVLPLLALLYLYEVEVYESEPVLVLGVSLIAGMGLGFLDALVIGRRLTDEYATSTTIRTVLLAGVVAPLVAQALMLGGPMVLLLLRRRGLDEALDGLAFGVTAALSFSFAVMLVNFWPIIVNQVVATQSTVDWAARLLRSGLLAFVVNAAATGAITTALWLRRHGHSRSLHSGVWRSLPLTVVFAVLVQVGLGIAGVLLDDLFLLVVVWAVGAAMTLLWLRIVIHHALLEEGGPLHIGPATLCVECHHMVPAMAFCPVCGAARSASPKVSLVTGVPEEAS